MSYDPAVYAAALRSLGWTCVPPVDPAAAIPLPAPGQLWVSPKPRIAPRMVIGIEMRYGQRYVRYKSTGTASGGAARRAESWAEWAKKSGARPQP